VSIVRTTPFERITRVSLAGPSGRSPVVPDATIETRPEDRLSFDRPLALLALVALVALAAAYVVVARRRPRYVVAYSNVEVLRTVAARPSPLRRHAAAAALGGALALACVAVAGPHVTRSAAVENATVVLVVDTSRSMLSEDVAPTRLGAAKAAAQTFLDRVPAKLRVGLVTFAGDVSVAAVPTHDRARLHRSVASITRWQAGGGTAIGDALARAVELAGDAFAEPGPAPGTGSASLDRAKGAVTILFLSDGRQNRGLLPPEEGAARAAQAGIPVFTVALGTDDPDPGGGLGGFGRFGGFNRVPDRATLRAIAEATGGEYFAARSADALESAYGDLGSRLGRTERPTEVTALFAAAASVALVAAAALGRLSVPGLP
jgi:Ca-activated chloride channel family protein